MKKLRLSSDMVFLGVCGGFAEFLEVDVTIVRIILALITVMSAFVGGIIAYLICYAIMKNS